jgi:hypothetical protein
MERLFRGCVECAEVREVVKGKSTLWEVRLFAQGRQCNESEIYVFDKDDGLKLLKEVYPYQIPTAIYRLKNGHQEHS